LSRTKGSWSGTDRKPILYPYYQYETITIRGREKYMLGEQIKRCREKRGFTQEQLAEKIGVSIETISSIERGIKMPRLQNFVAIANQLGVSADELLQDELDFGFIAEANALSKKLEELSRADRKRILETMNFLIVQAGGKPE
jgi:transcriptional regulator with XRE-family HTH domain